MKNNSKKHLLSMLFLLGSLGLASCTSPKTDTSSSTNTIQSSSQESVPSTTSSQSQSESSVSPSSESSSSSLSSSSSVAPVIKTGTVTIGEYDTALATISVDKESGNVGDEVTVTVALKDQCHLLSTLTVNGTDIKESKKFTIVEGSNVIAASFQENHSYTEKAYDDNQHWSKCSRCDSITEKTAHTFALAVTSQPTKTKYVKGQNFDKTGLVLTKSCECGYSHILADNEYTLDKTTLGVEDTSVTATCGELTASIPVTVDLGAVTKIEYEGDSMKIAIGGSFGAITQKVKVTYESGDVLERGTDCEDIEFVTPSKNATLGMKYVIKVQSKADNSIYTEIPAVIEKVLQGEDATIVNGSKNTETEYVIEDGAYVEKGDISFAGGFSNAVKNGKEAYVEFDMQVYTDANLDLTFRCANSNLRKDNDGYYMADLQINTIVDLYVNDTLVAIPDSVILGGIETRNSKYAPCYNVYSTFTIEDIPMVAGNNKIQFKFKTSTTGEANSWNESPSSMNIDYISMTSAGSEVTGDISAIEFNYLQPLLNYKMVILGTYGNKKAILTDDEYTVTRVLTEDTIMYTVTLKSNPSISITKEVANSAVRLEAENGTTFGKSENNNKKPAVNKNETQYKIENGAIVEMDETNTYVGGFDATTSNKNATNVYNEAGLTVDANFIGHFTLDIRMTNQSVVNTGGVYKTSDLDLSKLMKVEVINSEGVATALDLTGKVLPGSGDVENNTTKEVRDKLFNTFQTVRLGEVDLVEGSQIKVTYFHQHENGLSGNCWSENPAGNIDYLEIKLANKTAN